MFRNKENRLWSVFMILLTILLITPIFCADNAYTEPAEGYALVDIKVNASSLGSNDVADKVSAYRAARGLGKVSYSYAAERAAQEIAMAYAVNKYPPAWCTKEISKYYMGSKLQSNKGWSTGSYFYWSFDKAVSVDEIIKKGSELPSYYYKNIKYVGIAQVEIPGGRCYYGFVLLPDADNFKKKTGSFALTAPVPNNKVGGIVLSGDSSVNVGETTTMTASVAVSGQFEILKGELTGAEWSSSDTSIATVSNTGVITGVSEGKVKITVLAGEKKATKVITISGKSQPSGSGSSYNVKKLNLKAKTKAVEITWKKPSKSIKGYEIQYSTDKNFKKNVKTVTLKKASAESKTIKKLRSKKTYYFRIRTKYTKSGDVKYSSWSKTKKIKTK